MADKEREVYRPRRAYIEPQDATATTGPSGAGPSGPGPAGPATPANVDPEDQPPPLYRDQVRPAGEPGDVGEDTIRVRSNRPPDAGLSEETQILSRARAKRTRDADATTILPRTASGGRVRPRPVVPEDDFDDSPGPDRGRMALLVGAVAAVAVIGLAVGYALLRLTEQPSATPGPAPTMASTSSNTSPTGSPAASDPAALLTDASMLTATAAADIDDKLIWEVALTQKGRSADSPQPACLGVDLEEGEPAPQQTMLRLLSADGKEAPGVLHQAESYATPEEAAQAYAVASKTLGDCTMTATYIDSGRIVGGLGDQSLGIVLNVTDGEQTEFRTLVVSRTGRVVNVVDVAQPDRKVTVSRVAAATETVVDAQCRSAGGRCADDITVKAGPPPVGGDQPGFLAPADLPPVGEDALGWVGDTPRLPDDQVRGSGCETVDWADVEAESRAHRTYLLQDSTSKFGLDQVVVVARTEKAATELVEEVKGDWGSCEKRQLTATVAQPSGVGGTGAKNVDIQGWTTEVEQKSTDGTANYRVGIVSAGRKVVFTFLNPVDGLDLTDAQFDAVSVRAGERATQVN